MTEPQYDLGTLAQECSRMINLENVGEHRAVEGWTYRWNGETGSFIVVLEVGI
jgi:hypothetical protein